MLHRGVSLIEYSMVILIWSTLSLGLLQLHPRLQSQVDLMLSTHTVFTTLHLAKMRAQHTGLDHQVLVSPHQLTLQADNQIIQSHNIPRTISLKTGRRNKLGFKANSHTQYAGTITLSSQALQKKVSLSVGPGRIHRQ